jgi:signal transduction histidine kinase
LLRKEINNVTDQLSKINGNKTNSKILLPFRNKSLENLALEINKTLEEKSKTEVIYKRMDLELRQAIANISHDLRTPLTSIIGYIQLIEDDSLEESEKRECINVVKSRAESLKTLISSFYDLSRLEAGEYKFELRSLNLANILCDILASFYNDFLSKGIEPVIEIDNNSSLVIGDDTVVRRVFSNLIGNMLKHGEKNVEISLREQDNFIYIVFKNDAPGLNEGDLSHLFDRFFTVDRTRNGKNTGLGLAITKELINQMGQKVYAELKLNKLSITIKYKKGFIGE